MIARNHHYVPEFLLSPWIIKDKKGNHLLHGYFWNKHKNEIGCRKKGSSAFCYRTDLLTLSPDASRPDALETEFFSPIDDRGAKVRDLLLQVDPRSLSTEQRSDFARLLLSLETRRPQIVERLRTEAPKYLAQGLDSDPIIATEFARRGISMTPSEYTNAYVNKIGDRAVAIVQPLTDNDHVGLVLVNAAWTVFEVKDDHGSFILSDRPLVKNLGYTDPRAYWILPLSPSKIFVAANRISTRNSILQQPPHQIVRQINVLSAKRADQYVFAIDPRYSTWLGKYLQRSLSHSNRPILT